MHCITPVFSMCTSGKVQISTLFVEQIHCATSYAALTMKGRSMCEGFATECNASNDSLRATLLDAYVSAHVLADANRLRTSPKSWHSPLALAAADQAYF